MKIIGKTLKWLSTAAILILLVLAFLLVGIKFFGFEIYTVLSGSMEPLYTTGSVIYVKEADPDTLQQGDVITFAMASGTTATHRIVELVKDETDSSIVRFRTKGDANNVVDGTLVEKSAVIGTPVFSIPNLGFLAAHLQTKYGRYMILAACGAVLLMSLVSDILTEDNKKSAEAPKQD